MASSEEKPIFMHKNPPSKHQDVKVELDVDLEHEDEVLGKGCDWFSFFCLNWRRNDIDETDSLLPQRGEHTETWWKCKLKKLKEVSEKLAGPKWKNFIRKMSGYCNKRKTQKNRFQYDPFSYALNFDNGADKEGDDLHQDFSSRFAAPFADERQRAGSGM
ncbi:uncharacterized protein LOC111284680 [Durio zibethinus]|uniref:Uncharacterized protein LOC111284680 n=1 Tax=Durio zibethinus TaxID=66656 RepID=A0A6P5XLP8_DURZI|nr:uncharacterized protein LOC111284680 [Durio zibethinus]